MADKSRTEFELSEQKLRLVLMYRCIEKLFFNYRIEKNLVSMTSLVEGPQQKYGGPEFFYSHSDPPRYSGSLPGTDKSPLIEASRAQGYLEVLFFFEQWCLALAF